MQEKQEWVCCPVCQGKTRIKIRADTVLRNFPLYCPKCRHETLINTNKFNVTIIAEPDASDAEPMNM